MGLALFGARSDVALWAGIRLRPGRLTLHGFWLEESGQGHWHIQMRLWICSNFDGRVESRIPLSEMRSAFKTRSPFIGPFLLFIQPNTSTRSQNMPSTIDARTENAFCTRHISASNCPFSSSLTSLPARYGERFECTLSSVMVVLSIHALYV